MQSFAFASIAPSYLLAVFVWQKAEVVSVEKIVVLLVQQVKQHGVLVVPQVMMAVPVLQKVKRHDVAKADVSVVQRVKHLGVLPMVPVHV